MMNTNTHTRTYICIYGKCLGFAWNRNHDRQRIIIIITTITTTNTIIIIIIVIISIIIIITIIIKPILKIFNECRSSTGVGELNPYRRSSMNVEV